MAIEFTLITILRSFITDFPARLSSCKVGVEVLATPLSAEPGKRLERLQEWVDHSHMARMSVEERKLWMGTMKYCTSSLKALVSWWFPALLNL